jgi:2-succinyl-5-enolpyruvyl-6-hydroxy-3-cyclohexene-1-carboxylate synthase
MPPPSLSSSTIVSFKPRRAEASMGRTPDPEAPAGEDVYTHHIATPTGLDFAKAAALYGIEHEAVFTVAELRETLERALLPEAGSTIVHVRSDRARNVELHRRVWGAVAASISDIA